MIYINDVKGVEVKCCGNITTIDISLFNLLYFTVGWPVCLTYKDH